MDIHVTPEKIKFLSPDALKPNPKNRNKHPEDQIKRLMKLIEYQGFRQPIIVSTRSGFVVAGHGRLEAAKKLALKEVPVLYQDFASDEQEYAFGVSDNAVAAWADLDLSGINMDISAFGPDLDISLLGIKNFVIDVAEKGGLTDPDSVPTNVDTRVKPGDVWRLGEHRLMCGDSTSIDAVEKLMNGEKADMVFTDPPYGINYDAQSSGYTGAAVYGKIINDDKAPDLNFIFGMNIPTVIFGANNFPSILPHRGRWLVWDKRSDSVEDNAICDGVWGSQVEIAWCNKTTGIDRIFRVKHGGFVNRDGGKRVHPTQKPTQLIMDILESDRAGRNVFDGFGGSGSTLIACEKTNRKCFMSEIDPHYCDVILSRWMNFTGQMAFLVEDSSGKLSEPVPYANQPSSQ